MSDWCSTTSLLTLSIIFMVPLGFLKKYAKKPHIKKIKDRCIVSIPFFGRLMYEQTMYQFLQTTALLLQGGIHEVPALQAACTGLDNDYIRLHVQAVINDVQNGQGFANALSKGYILLQDEVQVMIAVGEESGTLSQALERGAQWYKKEVERLLHIISLLIQPCLMIVLGLCITALIFAVYMPVLQLSYVIT